MVEAKWTILQDCWKLFSAAIGKHRPKPSYLPAAITRPMARITPPQPAATNARTMKPRIFASSLCMGIVLGSFFEV